MAKEPTILVKQEDGTSVRMTLGEFKAWREKRLGTAASKATVPMQKTPKQTPPSKPEETELPMIDAPEKQPSQRKEEKPSGDEPIAGMFLPKEEEMNASEEKNMNKESAMKAIDPELPPPEAAPASMPTPKPKVEPEKTSEAAPTPDHTDKKPSLAEQLYRQSQSKPASIPANSDKIPTPASPAPVPKPVMNTRKPGVDPVSMPPPRRTVMGPVDEFAVITLADFRRMSSQPAEAAKRLKEKFMTLQDESYLMYLEGMEAWKQSPLYKQYQGVLVGALEAGQSLEKYVSGQGEMTLADMEAIAELNSSLL